MNKSLKYFEPMTSPGARRMLVQSGFFSQRNGGPLVILDNACGAGIVAKFIYTDVDSPPLKYSQPVELICGDLNAPVVEIAKDLIAKEGWQGATARVIDAQDNKLPSDKFTHVFMNFALFMIPKSLDALTECVRVLEPGGALAFTTWNSAGWFEDYKTAVSRIPGVEAHASMASMFKYAGDWCDPAWIQERLSERNLFNIKVELFQFKFRASSAEEYCANWAGVVPMLTSLWSEDQKMEKAHLIMRELQKVFEKKHGVGKSFDLDMVAIVSSATKQYW